MGDEKLIEPETWAVVEVMGHNTFAGKVSQHVIGGTAFIRVDVQEIEQEEDRYGSGNVYVHPAVPAFTKLIGASSIYAITPCSESVALQVSKQKRASPVSILDLPPSVKKLTGGKEEAEADEEYELGDL